MFHVVQTPPINKDCLCLCLCKTYFQDIMETTHRLNYLLPCQRCNKYDVRRFNKYPLPEIRTNRYCNSLIPWGQYHWQFFYVKTTFYIKVIPCQINQFFAKFARPPPISMKFGTLADNAWKRICANVQRCWSSGFRDMTFQKMEEGSIFAKRPVSQMSITFFY